MKKTAGELNKYIFYGLFMLFIFIIQGFIPRIMGASALPLIPLVVIIAMYVGETGGAVFGLAAGILIDLNSVHLAGFAALVLMIIGCVCGLLSIHLMRNTMLSCLTLSLGASFVYFILYWICFWLFPWREQMVDYLLRYTLVSTLYTAALAPPLYIILRKIFRRQRKKMRYS